ncbi:MAG: phosphomevalonate kinase [Candidatus Diapherotrites archaeon]|uniref:phosphomevalonate kinase n=1 Tax=Candidatus Iainarchaeum sp. TaxID=3101447 RepID=A0A2D6LPR5_9ARCH|nr:phosphomevalonate kinase [Candidatus Diapherotrites archaeon]|tara:strand:- start:9608 stop:10708 length:1101 start_codon:yes stop_codon:yes gene_type:complete
MNISAPGKLMLSGEWSVLENGVPCIVLAVDQRVYASIEEASETKINLKDFEIETNAVIEGTKISFEKEDEKLLFTKHSIETALKYIAAKGIAVKNFELETRGDNTTVAVNGKQMKVGFGSSAAAVTAITGAVLKLHGIDIETKQGELVLFKLAIIAHFNAQGKVGSGFDVGASVFGGALVYKRFDAEWLVNELQEKSVQGVADEEWPGFEARNISLPKELELMVGFTGKSASTKELVLKIREFKKEKPEEYEKIIESIKEVTEKLIIALQNSEKQKIIELLNENRKLLKTLSDASNNNLEIEEHKIMSEIASANGCAAKFSGAGGGDSSVGICFEKETKEKVLKEWKEKGIIPIEANVSENGATVE